MRVPGAVQDFVACASLVALCAWLASAVANVDWVYLDVDTVNLALQAQQFGPRDYFLRPAVQAVLSSANLAPWVTASFDLDVSMFGAEGRIFRVHQWISVSLLALSTYALARRAAGPLLAATAAALFLASRPVATALSWLSIRHYVEGLVFLNLALLLYSDRERDGGRGQRTRRICSAAFYGLATTAKEVFVPLPLFLFAAERGPARERLGALGFHLAVAFLYVPWRLWMLSGGGGYMPVTPMGLVHGAWPLIAALPEAAFAPPVISGMVGTMLAGLAILAIFGRHVRSQPIAVAVACVLGPILTVAWLIAGFGLDNSLRFFLLPTWLAIVGLAFFSASLRTRAGRSSVATVIGLLAIPAAIGARAELGHRAELQGRGRACVDLLTHAGSDMAIDLGRSPIFFANDFFAALAQVLEGSNRRPGPALLSGGRRPTGMRTVELRAGFDGCSVDPVAEGPARLDERESTPLPVAAAGEIRVAWAWDRVGLGVVGTGGRIERVGIESAASDSIPPYVFMPTMDGMPGLPLLRRSLFVHRVRPPAFLVVDFRRRTPGPLRQARIPIPEEYFDFWTWARPGRSGDAAPERVGQPGGAGEAPPDRPLDARPGSPDLDTLARAGDRRVEQLAPEHLRILRRQHDDDRAELRPLALVDRHRVDRLVGRETRGRKGCLAP